MRKSDDRILTTLVGSLPRPPALLERMKAKYRDGVIDPNYHDEVARAVVTIVQQQADCGIDVLSDGEMSKAGFFAYVQERLEGFEERPGEGPVYFAAEVAAFPEYYEEYFKRALFGGNISSLQPMGCIGPIRYKGSEALQRDLANLASAASRVPHQEVFVPSVAPSGVGFNCYYKSDEEFLFAAAEAMRVEYLAITEAGFVLQIDEPFVADLFADPTKSAEEASRLASLYVAAINHGLRGIPEDRVRVHTCYGINEGPRIHEANLADVIDYMLQINAGAYSFEAANCRHEHEYHLWETKRLPEGKAIIPGVVSHAGNIVEHPELIAERIMRFAKLVGRQNVMVAPDCGFSSQACFHPEVHPTVMWEKLRAMTEGARIASARLWA